MRPIVFLLEVPYPIALPKKVKDFVQIPLGNNIFVDTSPGDLKGRSRWTCWMRRRDPSGCCRSSPTVALVAVLMFVLMRLLPGDPAIQLLGDRATDADIARLRHELGFDRSVAVQFWIYLVHARHAATSAIRSRCMRR